MFKRKPKDFFKSHPVLKKRSFKSMEEYANAFMAISTRLSITSIIVLFASFIGIVVELIVVKGMNSDVAYQVILDNDILLIIGVFSIINIVYANALRSHAMSVYDFLSKKNHKF